MAADEEVGSEELLTVQQRMAQLESLVEKRRANFAYLRKVHTGNTFWLNCVMITADDLDGYVQGSVPALRSVQYFYLALSLGKLLSSPPGAVTIRALQQLFDEFEYHFSNSAMQMVKFATAHQAESIFPQLVQHHEHRTHLNSPNVDHSDLDRGSHVGDGLLRFGHDILYVQLHTPHVPFALDYMEVVYSLCDVLSLIYNKFLDEQCWTNDSLFELVVKVDMRVKHHVINLLAKELTDLSTSILRKEMASLRSNMDG